MVEEKNIIKIQEIFLGLSIIALPFDSIPDIFSISIVGTKLSLYFTIIALLSCIIRNIFWPKKTINNILYLYIRIYLCWQIICLFHGVINYEYINFLKEFQSNKLDLILKKFPIIVYYFDREIIVKIYIFLRLSVNKVLLPTITCWGTVYLIYDLYMIKKENMFFIIRRYVLILAFLCGIYSILEVFVLKFNNIYAYKLLKIINPYLYDVSVVHGWWPPLIWENQLRSLCTEPSHFGIIVSLIIPFLWSYLYESKNIKTIFTVAYFSFLIYLTQARTAIVLYIGELGLLYLISIFERKKYFTTALIVTIITSITFIAGASTFFDEKYTIKYKEYLNNNVLSIADSNARSNNARYINLVTNIKVAEKHIIFGVGDGLKDAYIANYLNYEDLNNQEVRNWQFDIYKNGPFKSEFPVVNGFINIIINNGIVGLILWFLPMGYVIIKIYRNWFYLIQEYNFIFILIAWIASIVAMFSNYIFFTYYISLGAILTLLNYFNVSNVHEFSKSKKKDINN